MDVRPDEAESSRVLLKTYLVKSFPEIVIKVSLENNNKLRKKINVIEMIRIIHLTRTWA